MKKIHLKFMAASISALLISSTPLQFMAAELETVPAGTPAQITETVPADTPAQNTETVPADTPSQITETAPADTQDQITEATEQEGSSETGENSGSEAVVGDGENSSENNSQENSSQENNSQENTSQENISQENTSQENTSQENSVAENAETGNGTNNGSGENSSEEPAPSDNSGESSSDGSDSQNSGDAASGIVPKDEMESGEEVSDPSAIENPNTDTENESISEGGASVEEPVEQGEEASGEAVAPAAGDEFPVNGGDSSESSGGSAVSNSGSSTDEIEAVTIVSEDDEATEDSEDQEEVREEIKEEIKEEEKTGSESEKIEDLSSLSVNYLKFLPDYRLDGENKNEGLKVNFDGVYRPGQVSVAALPIPEVTDGDKGLALYLEYYDRNPQYDGRIRDWDNSYYSPATGKWKAPKESDSDYSNSVSVNAALVWAKVSENGLIIPDEGASALEGVRIKDVKFRSDADATLNENGDFYDNVDKRDEKRSYFTVDLAISGAKAGLSKQQVKQIKDSMRGRGSDTAFRFPFGVTKRSLTGNSGQYEKLTLSVDDDGAVKVEALQMKIDGGEEDGETYLSLDLPEDSPEDAIAGEGADFAPGEELAGSSAIVKEIAEDGSSIVLEGSGNFTGEAVWSQDPETGKYSLR